MVKDLIAALQRVDPRAEVWLEPASSAGDTCRRVHAVRHGSVGVLITPEEDS